MAIEKAQNDESLVITGTKWLDLVTERCELGMSYTGMKIHYQRSFRMFSLFGPQIVLRGDYAGYRDASITYRFRFCSDGTYFYLVEQKGRWRLAHQGTFRISDVRDPNSEHKKLTICRFEPRTVDLRPSDQEAISMLETRALLTDQMEEYVVSTYETENAWNRNVKCLNYSFVRPDPDGGMFSTSWHLQLAA